MIFMQSRLFCECCTRLRSEFNVIVKMQQNATNAFKAAFDVTQTEADYYDIT